MLLGAATAMWYEFFNEMVENGQGIYPNEDCIPDFLIIQPLGVLLFSSDKYVSFFSVWVKPKRIGLNHCAISFTPLAFRNPGQNFVMKYAIKQSKSTSLFFISENFVLLGLSFKKDAKMQYHLALA